MSALGELVSLVIKTGKPQEMTPKGYRQLDRDLRPLRKQIRLMREQRRRMLAKSHQN